jgi:hypothetical protein
MLDRIDAAMVTKRPRTARRQSGAQDGRLRLRLQSTLRAVVRVFEIEQLAIARLLATPIVTRDFYGLAAQQIPFGILETARRITLAI